MICSLVVHNVVLVLNPDSRSDTQTHLEMLKIRSLQVDNLSKQLVLQPISGDSEVNKSGLSLDFWLVVGIGQLSVQNESEVSVKDALLISHFNEP